MLVSSIISKAARLLCLDITKIGFVGEFLCDVIIGVSPGIVFWRIEKTLTGKVRKPLAS